MITTDPSKLRQVVTNLVENACKYGSLRGLLIEGAVDVGGGDGAKFGEGKADRLGDLDALDKLDRTVVIVGVKSRPGLTRATCHQPEARVQADGVPADPGLASDLADQHD